MHKLWKRFIAAIALAGGLSSVAIADGYQPVGKGFAAPKGYNWTGFYAGVHAGGAWSADTSAALSGDPLIFQPCIDGIECFDGLEAPFIPSSLDPDSSGLIGGAQAGYNWQVGSVVIGFETDVSYSGLDDGESVTNLTDFFGAPVQTSLDTDIKWFSTVRGRLGFLPHDQWLVFATGGLAFGETEQTLRLVNTSPIANIGFGTGGAVFRCPAASTCLAGSNSETSVGWTGGGGFEFAVSDHVTLKGYYLYVDLGSSTVTAKGVDPATTSDVFLRAKVENTLNVLRAGLNVKLN